MYITSSFFENNGSIPKQCTCEGENISPELEWTMVPGGVKSLALIMDDPDATSGVVFTHWMIWNIPPSTESISSKNIPEESIEGINDFGKQGYGGPCPARGKPHHYRFRLYALSDVLSLQANASVAELEEAIAPYLMAEAELVGIYER